MADSADKTTTDFRPLRASRPLPTPPSAAGEYLLRATVTGTGASRLVQLTWVDAADFENA